VVLSWLAKEEVSVIVGPSLLREIKLPLHSKGDRQDFGGHEKELVVEEKVDYLFQYNTFMGMRGGIGGLLEMLLYHTQLSRSHK
jgi:hypothetical protein